MAPVILYYALGGGLGHLTRARAGIETLGLTEVTLLTASPFAADPRVVGTLPTIAVPPALADDLDAWRAWLAALLARLRPAALYLDAFPLGIRGELAALPLPPGLAIHYLARGLRWNEYRRVAPGAAPPLAVTYLLEPLEPAHEAFVRAASAQVRPLLLRDPPSAPTMAEYAHMAALAQDNRPLWLIVHSGPAAEIEELVDYAHEQARAEGMTPTLVLIAQERPVDLPEEIAILDRYPAEPFFPLAARLITAAGFNIMRQAMPYRAKHRPLPFPRRFDDQFARVARWRLGGG